MYMSMLHVHVHVHVHVTCTSCHVVICYSETTALPSALIHRTRLPSTPVALRFHSFVPKWILSFSLSHSTQMPVGMTRFAQHCAPDATRRPSERPECGHPALGAPREWQSHQTDGQTPPVRRLFGNYSCSSLAHSVLSRPAQSTLHSRAVRPAGCAARRALLLPRRLRRRGHRLLDC